MWELIQANKRKSIILFIGMGICLLLLGYLIGAAYLPGNGGVTGLFITLGIWLFWSLISYFSGGSMLLAISKAKEVSHDVHPQLFNVVEEMRIAANSPFMPKIYIIDEPALNAFATGTKPEKCAIAITAGLLSGLNRDELQGVVAHEMSHIINRDVLFMTFTGILLGSIVIISEVFFRSLWYSSRSSKRYRSSKGGGQAQIIIFVVAIIFAILAPILARLFYFAISRKREYLADASAVRLTRYPEGLASALEKLSSAKFDLPSANKVTAPMYIVNPLKKKGMRLSNLTSTHPPISERIKILRGMMQGVSYSNYQEAFSRVKGQVSAIVPASSLRETETIPIRKTLAGKQEKQAKRKDMRDIGDLMRAVNKYAFLICACGLKIKVPPNFNKAKIPCPRCRREIEIPLAQMAAAAAVTGTHALEEDIKKGEQATSKTYVRKGTGWESFSCSCGQLLNVSPLFTGLYMTCHKCGRKIEIKD
ncbi:MAG: M48 family metallopeptidase [Candidatus Omnitrophota bacterium]